MSQDLMALVDELPGLCSEMKRIQARIGEIGALIAGTSTPEPVRRTSPAAPQAPESVPQKPAKRRGMSVAAKKRMSAAAKDRWAVVKQAGIKTAGRLPTGAEVERARAILKRRTKKNA